MNENSAKVLSLLREEAKSPTGAACLSVQAVADAAALSWDDTTVALADLINNHGLFARFAGVDGDPVDDSDGVVIYQFFLKDVAA